MARLLLNPKQQILWQSNAIIAGNGGQHESDSFLGSLSIKTVISGRVTWRTPLGQYTVQEGAYLVLNHGQTYNLKVEEPSETFCVFFKPGLIEEIAGSDSSKAADLLEPAQTAPRGFFERINPLDQFVAPMLRTMRRNLRSDLEPWEADELFLKMASALLSGQSEFRKETEGLSIAKAPVRQEIHRRLGVARDYMLSNLTRPLNLETIAAEAYLSPFHFHRLFKQAFRCTPHEFVKGQRLARARRLLRSTDQPLASICVGCGFESLGSFCRLFKAQVGFTPTEYRQAKGSF